MDSTDRIGSITIQTACGQIRGNERTDCLEFLGRALRPGGALCVRSALWSAGTVTGRHAFGPACPQNRAWHEHLEHPTRRFYKHEYREGLVFTYDEDCLNLNIYTPKDAENAPVIVFFYGGGFDSGLNWESPFDGSALARQGIVTVFANYRVGPLGYLTHEKIQKQYGGTGTSAWTISSPPSAGSRPTSPTSAATRTISPSWARAPGPSRSSISA